MGREIRRINGARNAIPNEEWEKVLAARAAGLSKRSIWLAGLPSANSIRQKLRDDPAFAARYEAALATKRTAAWTDQETAFLEANRLRMSASAIATELGKSRKAVELRLRRLRRCGRKLDGSFGWWRVEENAFIKANASHMTPRAILRFLRGRKLKSLERKIAKLNLPSARRADGPKPQDILGMARKATPVQLRRDARDDITSAIMVAVVEGRVGIHEIGLRASGFVSAYWRENGSKFKTVSLDAPAFSDGDRTPLVERIADDQSPW